MNSVTLHLYDALVAVKIPADKAKAVVESIEDAMLNQLASKTDLTTAVTLLTQQITSVSNDVALKITSVGNDVAHSKEIMTLQLVGQTNKLIVVMSTIVVAIASILFAALRYFPPVH